jgi:hypothetical protein
MGSDEAGNAFSSVAVPLLPWRNLLKKWRVRFIREQLSRTPGDEVKTNFVAMAALALLALSSCAKEDTNSNTPSARDAAPGSLSETSPPSTPADDQTQDEASADH